MSCALLTQILDDIKTAMKAHDAETLGTLRTLHSDIKNEAMKSGATPAQITESITDAMCIDVLAKSVKQKQESIEILKKGGFLDKIPAEEAVIAIYPHCRNQGCNGRLFSEGHGKDHEGTFPEGQGPL